MVVAFKFRKVLAKANQYASRLCSHLGGGSDGGLNVVFQETLKLHGLGLFFYGDGGRLVLRGFLKRHFGNMGDGDLVGLNIGTSPSHVGGHCDHPGTSSHLDHNVLFLFALAHHRDGV